MNWIARLWSRVFRRAPKAAPVHALPARSGALRTLDTPPGLFRGALAVDLAAGSGATAKQLAPPPMVDKYPIVRGQQLTLQYLASTFRLATMGQRQQYVDVLDELLEREPHGFAVLSQRFLTVAGGRVEITPAECADEADEERAEALADLVRAQVAAIPDLKASLLSLLWGLYYGPTCLEILWDRGADGWSPSRLSLVHPRRLGYPDPSSWDLHIWDQGQVLAWGQPMGATQATGGLRLADYPGKFIVHIPQLRGDYPTREGLGRQLADWFLLKRMAARGAAQYLERFAKPWAIAYYNTGEKETGPRVADQDDILAGEATMQALGAGALSSSMLPDSIKVAIDTAASAAPPITYLDFINATNGEISKAVLGQTLTTEVGSTGGNRALGEVQKRGSMDIARYDAACLCESLRRDLVTPIVKLNGAPDDLRLLPQITIHVEDEPAPLDVMAVATAAVAAGLPVDADALAARIGLDLIARDYDGPAELAPRRAALVKPVELSAIDESIEPPPAPVAPGQDPNAEPTEGDADTEEDDAAPAPPN